MGFYSLLFLLRNWVCYACEGTFEKDEELVIEHQVFKLMVVFSRQLPSFRILTLNAVGYEFVHFGSNPGCVTVQEEYSVNKFSLTCEYKS